ncbi:hypothetical protein NW754_001461 [Fusarium falciforme]|uniref:Uncharacterized protein n=1 Tax=Fusarium falciforme TaxID=195108 RepID=A0A9W8QTA6_9HYPO|nr:hypothetical protein NW754_001461 [Fusarium falciforme]KAJ4175736.1 hypothetical protein NW755_014787 [Fusarium falciforme]KAJ4175950.1 hypothetical protein NW767_015613 [Fusarium falciforme]KAJ4179863.1 hypothetical protein NW759_017267 [Fusarium solani]
MRVVLDLHAIQNATRVLRGTVPQEIIETVRRQLVGTIVESRLEILVGDIEETTRLTQTIKSQLSELYRSIDRYNPHFWPSMFNNPAAAIAARPVAYSAGSQEEAHLMLGYNFAAWAETPGAIDMIMALRQTT